MLQRVIIHLSLIVLFALTQMGVATHAISHIADDNHHHQRQDQNSTEKQCGQCLSLNHIANADIAATFDFQLISCDQILTAVTLSSFYSLETPSYSARAPPHASQA